MDTGCSFFRSRMVIFLIGIGLLSSMGCQQGTPSGLPTPMGAQPATPANPQPTFRPTASKDELNIDGMALGIRGEPIAPDLLWSHNQFKGIRSFEVDKKGLTKRVDGLPLMRGDKVLVGHGMSRKEIEKVLGKPDATGFMEIRYVSAKRVERIVIKLDKDEKAWFVHLFNADAVVPTAKPPKQFNPEQLKQGKKPTSPTSR